MNRRKALATVAAMFGGTVVGAELFLSGCSSNGDKESVDGFFSPDHLRLLEEVSETILPTSAHSPGAKEAQVAAFMAIIVSDCYTSAEQQTFLNGIDLLNNTSKQRHGIDFVDLSSEEKQKLLVTLDGEAKQYASSKKHDDPEHYFTMMKQLTLWGYFTSEPGSTKALRYNPVPGRYDGCIDYKKGDRAWSAI